MGVLIIAMAGDVKSSIVFNCHPMKNRIPNSLDIKGISLPYKYIRCNISAAFDKRGLKIENKNNNNRDPLRCQL